MLREGRQVCLVLPSFRNLFSDKWFTSLSSVFSWQTYLLLPPDSGQQVLAEVSDALLACLMGGALFLKGLGKTERGASDSGAVRCFSFLCTAVVSWPLVPGQ